MSHRSIQSLLDWLESKGLLVDRKGAEVYLLCHDTFSWTERIKYLLLQVAGLLLGIAIIILAKLAYYYPYPNVTLFILYAALLTGLLTLTMWKKRSVYWDVIVVACLLSISIISIIVQGFEYNLLLAFFLVGLCLDFSAGLKSFYQLPSLCACLSLILLALIGNAALVWAVALLMLGYRKHNRLAIAFGFIYLIVFTADYFYRLPFSTEYKSYLLIGTGCVFLIIAKLLKYLRWE